MPEPRKVARLDWEAHLAAVSLAGVRILVQSTMAPLAGAEATYTVADTSTKRVVLFHDSGDNTDIRFTYGSVAADASDLPVISGVYFVVDAEKGEVLRVFNTSAGTITVNVAELR